MSNELFRRVVQQFTSEACPTYLFGGLSNKVLSELTNVFKKKHFVLKTTFLTLGIYMREGVSEGSRCGKG